MRGMGREKGIGTFSAVCSSRSRRPASSLALLENGGVLISPCIQTSCLYSGAFKGKICHIGHNIKSSRTPSDIYTLPMRELRW